MLVFAPDWSYSNMAVLAKAARGILPGGKDELARELYIKYAIRSALLYAMVGEGIQQTAGKGSLFDNHKEMGPEGWLRPQVGDGKYAMISKQFSEVVHAAFDPSILRHKSSGFVKALGAENAGDVLSNVTPIAMSEVGRSGTGGISSVLGVPIRRNPRD